MTYFKQELAARLTKQLFPPILFCMTTKKYPLAVIGGGAAGMMALLRATLNNDEVLFFPGHFGVRKKSREMWINRVENMPTFAEYKKGIADPNRKTLKWILDCEFKENVHHMKGLGVTKLKKNDDGTFTLVDNEGTEYLASYVILATGCMDVQPMIGGSHQAILPYANAQKVEYCARCDGHHTHKQHTVILGHGAGAASVASLLAERYRHPSMTILTNGEEPGWDDDRKIILEKYRIDVNKKKIKEIVGEPKKGDLQGFRFEDDSLVQATYAFISLGMILYNELALEVGAEVDDRGFVVTDKIGHTNIDGFYVAGDLRAGIKNQIYTAWDSAVDSADHINARLRETKRTLILNNPDY
jgi:thioredoxin reductase (NADPH)